MSFDYAKFFTVWHESAKRYRLEEMDEQIKHEHMCGGCGRCYWWSADDISGKYEASAFMPCGCRWEWLDKAG